MSVGANRLPAPAGLLVDRDRPVSFAWEGARYQGLAGDSLASALAANDEWILSRSFKYHRPRGLLTMAGQDANTLVQLTGAPNVPADNLPISEGLEAWGQNTSGSLKRDRNAILARFARFMPVGFYYRAFYRPRGAWQAFWEPIVRRTTGLGKVDLATPHGYFDKAYGFCDLAVIGGGPAGLAAALAAARAGAEVLLVEENPVLGGALAYARFDADAGLAAARRAALVAEVEAEPRIEVMTGAVCNGWFADNWLPVIHGNRMHKVRAKEVVLATGSIEQPAIFRNNDLPGVMLGSAAQRLIRLYGVRPGRRALVLAGNDDGYGVALDLAEAGVEVAALVDLRPEPAPSVLAEAVAGQGIEVLAGRCVAEALASSGNRHVTGAVVSRIDDEGAAVPGGATIACDLLCMSVGSMPTYQLALQAGASLGYDDADARFSIAGLPDRLRLAGSVCGTHDLEAVLAEGRHAGWRAAQSLGLDAGAEPARARTSSTSTRICKSRTSSTPWPTATARSSWSSASRLSAWDRARDATRRWPRPVWSRARPDDRSPRPGSPRRGHPSPASGLACWPAVPSSRSV
jgi:sarcosine oxidase subunit alpha